MQRHSSVYDEPRMPPAPNRPFLEKFLVSILDAITFETQPADLYHSYTLDPTVNSLFRGFALAQRVLLSFNLHACALPEVRPMASHPLWDVWDIAIDIATSLEQEPAETMLYQLCVQTFDAFPSPGVYPLYTHFMLSSPFRADAAGRLLRLLDENADAGGIAARSTLRAALGSMDAPSETHLLMLAKMQVSDHAPELDAQLPIALAMSKRVPVIACGMLNVCLALSRGGSASFNKMTSVCIEHAADCAPLAAILLGLLIERGGRMLALRGFTVPFVDLCGSPRADVRATSVFLLGYASDPAVVQTVDGMVADTDEIVREQALWAMFSLVKNQVDRRGIGVIERFATDQSPVVRKAYDAAKLLVGQLKSGVLKDQQNPNPILKNLIASVRARGFAQRYATNIFEMPVE
jgi:hypothetical protein